MAPAWSVVQIEHATEHACDELNCEKRIDLVK